MSHSKATFAFKIATILLKLWNHSHSIFGPRLKDSNTGSPFGAENELERASIVSNVFQAENKYG